MLIWNRTLERAADLATRLREQDVDAVVEPELDAAIKQADLISTCTRSHVQLIKGRSPGAHLDLVGSYTLQAPEADDEAARRASVFVDCREPVFDACGILQPLASGAIPKDNVLGNLYDLVGGTIPG